MTTQATPVPPPPAAAVPAPSRAPRRPARVEAGTAGALSNLMRESATAMAVREAREERLAPTVSVVDCYAAERRGDRAVTGAVMEPLRDWVDWFITRWQIAPSEVPPCWWRHGPIMAELYALWCCYQLAHASTDSGAGPLSFMERLVGARQRLRSTTSSAGCTARMHEDAAVPAVLTEGTDSAQWYRMANLDGAS